MLPSGVFWTTDHCARFGGYICKKRSQGGSHTTHENRTITGTEGTISSPSKTDAREPLARH